MTETAAKLFDRPFYAPLCRTIDLHPPKDHHERIASFCKCPCHAHEGLWWFENKNRTTPWGDDD